MVVGFYSCKKDNTNEDFVTNVTHQVEVTFDDFLQKKPAEGVLVVFTNRLQGTSYQARTGTQGKLEIELPTAVYDINASLTLSATEMKNLSGEEKEIYFNASLQGKRITQTDKTPTVLELVSGKIGSLLIKQVYYVGSDAKQGADTRDQFFEIHNNSNETIYLDKLCFAQLHGVTLKQKDAQNVLTSGQIDWSKSPNLVGMGETANTDYVYSANVYSFPGTGKNYPLESGKSVIVAKTAQNHKAPLKIGEKIYQVPNPDLTVDLSKAHFEVYFTDDVEKDKTDIDNPNVPNMNIAYNTTTYKDLTLNEIGRDGFAIFYATDEDIHVNYKRVQSPELRRGKMSNRLYLQIPNSIIIDGVNLQAIDGAELPHRLPENIDAGQIKLTKGSKTSESAIRKEIKRIGNRVFYQDTNNSVNDFLHIDRPNTNSLNP